jgi:hypothetical protein
MSGWLKSNRDREAIHFQIFQEQYASFHDYVHTDNPDFLVRYDKETLGIEFTELYKEEQVNGVTLRGGEAIKERVVSNARQMAIDVELPPLHVTVHFSGTVKKKRERTVTESLFGIVKDSCGAEGTHVELDWNNSIPHEFRAIRLRRIPGCKKHFWKYIEASPIYTNFSDQLQRTISSKAEKFPEYAKRCDRCWLVIVALGLSGSSFYEFSGEMAKDSYESPFEKVFFLEGSSGNLRELRVNDGGPGACP